jgi:hypothetical protein
LDPYPGGSSGAFTRFFPEDIGLYQPESGSALNNPSTATSVLRGISGLQSFANVQASRFARHPGCTYRRVPIGTPGSRGFYVHAYLGSLPPRAVDMLAVRIEQLTAWGLSPHKIRSLVGCSPRLPLCAHAPLADPGGILSARHNASRTGAFRQIQNVSFPRLSPGYPFGPQIYNFRSSVTRPTHSLHLASHTPSWLCMQVRYRFGG